jgi:molybdopterin converting factor subunit 1
MTIHVRLFAIVRERAGVAELDLPMGETATVADAVAALAAKHPALKDFLPRCALAVNQNYVPATTPLNEGDELAVIPPVSGG